MLRSKIVATGSYLPSKILTNDDLSKMVDTSDEWIVERTGIRQRRILQNEKAVSDIALEASKRALKSAGLRSSELSMIIVATISGDMPMPATACILQKRLNAKNAFAFDINAACSGFIYALATADAFIKTGAYRHVLVVGAEALSRFTDWQDRTTCVLFGDGAGAVVVTAHKGKSGILSTHLYSDGSMGDLIEIPAGGSKLPATEETVKERLHFIKMKGNETFKFAVKALSNIVEDTLRFNRLTIDQVDLLIPHQANHRIIQAVASRVGIPMDKVMVNIDRYGNTSAASIPIALDEAVSKGRIKKGSHVLLEAFGGGLTWASALIRW